VATHLDAFVVWKRSTACRTTGRENLQHRLRRFGGKNRREFSGKMQEATTHPKTKQDYFNQDCQMVHFETPQKNNSDKFLMEILVYFTAISNILQAFGIFSWPFGN
jgi:hypothetical protein